MNNWTKIGGVAAAITVAVWALRNRLDPKGVDVPVDENQDFGHSMDEEDSFVPEPAKGAKRKKKPSRKKVKRPKKKVKEELPDLSRSQVAVTNNGTTAKTIHLWGSPSGSLVSTDPSNLEDQTVVKLIGEDSPIFNHPQGVAAHSDNSIYVVNQLGDTVTKISSDGQILSTIELGSLAPGTISPVAIATSSTTDGVFVVGSISNTVIVLDQDDLIKTTILVGSRPTSIGIHPVTGKIYVLNYRDETISVIDPNTHLVETTLNTGSKPMSIGFDPTTEKAYVVNQGDNSISVFTKDHLQEGDILNIGDGPNSIIYHPENGKLYVSNSADKQVVEIDPDTQTVGQIFSVGGGASRLAFHPLNGMLYVANKTDESFSVIDLDSQMVVTIPAAGLNIGWAIHPGTGQVFISATSRNAIAVLGFDPLGNIEVSENYFELNEDFRYNPARLYHTKWIKGAGEMVRSVTIKETSPTGMSTSFPVSLENYNSPQHGVQAAEITESNGWIIDGNHSWEFELSPGQSAIIIIYFHQWIRADELPT